MAEKRELTPEENKKANLLCGISICCMVLPMVIEMILGGILQTVANAGNLEMLAEGVNVVYALCSAVSGAGFIAAIVLVIIVRVQYPANVFGKVLMWVYIVFGIIAVIAFVVVVVACTLACNSCLDSCKGMGYMGTVRWK